MEIAAETADYSYSWMAWMTSRFGKLALVTTSLAPACGAFAILRVDDKQWLKCLSDWVFWLWVSLGLGLLAAAWRILNLCQTELKHTTIETQSIKTTDKDVLAFLIAYLLPLLGKEGIPFGTPLIAVYVYVLIFLAIYHSNSFHFNPMLSLIGFHFYEVQTTAGFTAILISQEMQPMQTSRIVIVQITPFVLLAVDQGHLNDSGQETSQETGQQQH